MSAATGMNRSGSASAGRTELAPFGAGTTADYEEVAHLLAGGRRFLITGHRNPDGDTLGSALALSCALEAAGKEGAIVMRDGWSSSYAWMPGIERVAVSASLPAGWPGAYDAVLVMECPFASRTGFTELFAGRVVNIDHHASNIRYGALNLVDLDAAATGEVIVDLLDLLEWPLTPEIATNLWVSLVSDTGSFRYGSTTPKALALGARLVASGAKPGDVNERLYESRPIAALRLEALVLDTLELHADGRVATLLLRPGFLTESGADPADSEGLVNRARGIEGVEAAALLTEIAGGVVRCSFRSKGNVDVRAVAERHGGGGHRNASGCELAGTLDAVKALLVAELAAAERTEG